MRYFLIGIWKRLYLQKETNGQCPVQICIVTCFNSLENPMGLQLLNGNIKFCEHSRFSQNNIYSNQPSGRSLGIETNKFRLLIFITGTFPCTFCWTFFTNPYFELNWTRLEIDDRYSRFHAGRHLIIERCFFMNIHLNRLVYMLTAAIIVRYFFFSASTPTKVLA